MPETRDIVVVGGGFAGQGTAHYFMRKSSLQESRSDVKLT